MISVSVSYQGKNNMVSVKSGANIGDVLEKIGINRETVIVRLGGEIVPETEKLKDKEGIEILRIISGG
jgi:sulfur carrier protein ThiS